MANLSGVGHVGHLAWDLDSYSAALRSLHPFQHDVSKLTHQRIASDNDSMNTANPKETGISPEVMADAKLVAECVAAGRPIPPEVARRIHEEAQKISERLRQQYGILDIGVAAIRELRGGFPR
jgi:hypothetical protein